MKVNNNQVFSSPLLQNLENQINKPLSNSLRKDFVVHPNHVRHKTDIIRQTVGMKSSIERMSLQRKQGKDILFNELTPQKDINFDKKVKKVEHRLKDSAECQKYQQEGLMNLLPLNSANSLDKSQTKQNDEASYRKSKLDYFDIDLESNQNYLPVSSLTLNKNNFCLELLSEDSDDDNCQTKKRVNQGTPFNDRKMNLDIFQSQELLICQKCYLLIDKNREQAQLISELTEEIQGLRQSLNKILQDQNYIKYNGNGPSSNTSLEIKEDISKPKILLQQLKEMLKTIEFMEEYEIQQIISCQEQCELINNCQFLLSKIINRYKTVDESIKIAKIHQKYKILIQKIKNSHRQQINRNEEDFKNFINLLSSKDKQNQLLLHRQVEFKNQSINRMKKYRTLIEKEDSLLQQQKHKQRVIELLQINLEKQKNKAHKYELYIKKIQETHRLQAKQLINQRNMYRQAAGRYQKEFEAVMSKLINTNIKLYINNSDLFKDVSQRVFQISNCIPFEENDEQHLFAPENQGQLYDMLEHIRQFYLKIEQFTAKKQRQYFTLKRNFIIFLKNLIENEKVSIRYMIDLINQHKELNFDYLKDYIKSFRKKKIEENNHTPHKRLMKGRSLTLTQAESFMCNNQQSYYQQNKF